MKFLRLLMPLSLQMSMLYPILAEEPNSLGVQALEVCPIFQNHAVIQRDTQLPIWGWAAPGETVTVQLAGQKSETEADKDGYWKVLFQPIHERGPYELVILGKKSGILKYDDILAGEVWLCAGQSNMVIPVGGTLMRDKAPAEAATLSHIREYTVGRNISYYPQAKITPDSHPLSGEVYGWKTANAESVLKMGGVIYPFARDLSRALGDVPVGIVRSCWGNTTAEAWIRREVLLAEPSFKPLVEQWDEMLQPFPDYQNKCEQYYGAYSQSQVDHKRLANKIKNMTEKGEANIPELPPKPSKGPFDRSNVVSALYNSMIHPLIPLSFKGILFYQGESNVPRAWQYRTLFPALINSWRAEWGRQLPFIFVQICFFRDIEKTPPANSRDAELREAQLLTLRAVPNTAMVVSCDTAEESIHPQNKEPIGARAALAAQTIAYGQKFEYNGPLYKSSKIEGNAIRVFFDYADGLRTQDQKIPRGFAIAGADQKWVWADKVVLNGDSVLVSAAAVPEPVAVRYGWARRMEVNLCNGVGLPASPFRTDDWKLSTDGRLR
jgi:sialate O-acetylesterase